MKIFSCLFLFFLFFFNSNGIFSLDFNFFVLSLVFFFFSVILTEFSLSTSLRGEIVTLRPHFRPVAYVVKLPPPVP